MTASRSVSGHSRILMQALLLELLIGLEQIGNDHEDLYDSEVRERIGNAVMEGFVRCIPDYAIRPDLGLFQPEANAAVSELIVQYVDAANALAADKDIVAFHDRLAAFQNLNSRTIKASKGFRMFRCALVIEVDSVLSMRLLIVSRSRVWSGSIRR